MPLGREIAPGAALLSPRGNVLEGDMPRFFRRFREGLFDEDDVRRRAGELADFVAEARRAYGLAQPLALGYSNGANIAAAVLLLHPKTLAGAILLRAMAPLAEPPRPDLSGVPVLILSGSSDPIAPRSNAEKLAAALAAAGARVERDDLPAGHGLTQADVTRAKAFYAREAAHSIRLQRLESWRREARGWPALELPGDERDDLGHDGRSRLIHRRRHVCSVG